MSRTSASGDSTTAINFRMPCLLHKQIEVKKDTQGGRANKSGRAHEKATAAVYIVYGFIVLEYKEWIKIPTLHTRCIVKNWPYRSIYSSFNLSSKRGNRSDFRMIALDRGIGLALVEEAVTGKKSNGNRGIHIECKNQDSPGSVVEKYPYCFDSAMTTVDTNETWFVIEGRKGLQGKDWLKNAAKSKAHKVSVLLRDDYENCKAAMEIGNEALSQYMKELEKKADEINIEVYNLNSLNMRLREMYS
jgi:hypothetical protein